jgi:hypothetical protein
MEKMEEYRRKNGMKRKKSKQLDLTLAAKNDFTFSGLDFISDQCLASCQLNK